MDDQGRSRLACKARNGVFDTEGRNVDRGVVSYYAARAIADAQTVEDWVTRINLAISRDHNENKLENALWVQMRVAGDPSMALAGERLNP